MQGLIRLYRLLNILSIDVAIGAVCCALFFARLLEVQILPYGLITLGLSVWIIYCVDHLIDASKVKRRASTARHRFHQSHFRQLMIVVAALTTVNAVLIFFIRTPVFIGGIVLMLMVGVYLVLHRFLRFPKEFLIALLYTGGILLPSISVTPMEFKEWPWLLIVQFLLTALLNLIIFSWFDLDNDRRDGNDSFVTMVGESRSAILILALVTLNVLLCLLHPAEFSSLILATMNLMLILIFLRPDVFRKDDRYRIFGDGIFFLPLIDLFVHG